MFSSWRKVRAIPYLREAIAACYYLLKGNRRSVCGNSNIITTETQEHLSLLVKSKFEIKGNSNTVSFESNTKVNNCHFIIEGDQNFICIGSGVLLENLKIKIEGDSSKVAIGKNCKIRAGFLWSDSSECRLTIGERTTIVEALIGVSEPKSMVAIGNDCMFAHGIDIRCGDSHSIIDLDIGKRINYAQDINIGSHVWLAANVQILKGVSLGENSIVGAGSIVTKDIPKNSLAVGIPAEIKRKNVTWVREKILPENEMVLEKLSS